MKTNALLSNRNLALINVLALIIVLALNSLANALPINGFTTGEISDMYPSVFTPAGITFSIWGMIYLLLIGFIFYQFKLTKEPYFSELSLWFILSCVANASWILVWHYLLTAASVTIMLVLLYSLINIFLLLHKNKMKSQLAWFFVSLPFIVYLSWICVATIANISTLLIALGWEGGVLPPQGWTIIMVSIAAALGGVVAYRFNEPSFLLVLIWALFGIYLRWNETENAIVSNYSLIMMIALGLIFIQLFVRLFVKPKDVS
jgi:benzodiazapine receptor